MNHRIICIVGTKSIVNYYKSNYHYSMAEIIASFEANPELWEEAFKDSDKSSWGDLTYEEQEERRACLMQVLEDMLELEESV